MNIQFIILAIVTALLAGYLAGRWSVLRKRQYKECTAHTIGELAERAEYLRKTFGDNIHIARKDRENPVSGKDVTNLYYDVTYDRIIID